jgi:pyruvyl transferase EpsO
MLFPEKLALLRKEIERNLFELITADYWLLDVPYYRNIGDILIWEGTEQFLKKTGFRCIYKASHYTFKQRTIGGDTIILLQGGGNFGDLWPQHHNFKRKIIESYPENRIIILPQTVYYTDKDKLLSDAALFANHKHLTICARDSRSYAVLKEYFPNNSVLLVPDMAFCISPNTIKRFQKKPQDKTLFLKRKDKELNNGIEYSQYTGEQFDAFDWPPMERKTISLYLLQRLLGASRRFPVLFPELTGVYASLFFKPAMIKAGVRFLSKYSKIYTTRLHGAILCCLLGKPFVFFDNSYGKNSDFFETWLSDLDEHIKFISRAA